MHKNADFILALEDSPLNQVSVAYGAEVEGDAGVERGDSSESLAGLFTRSRPRPARRRRGSTQILSRRRGVDFPRCQQNYSAKQSMCQMMRLTSNSRGFPALERDDCLVCAQGSLCDPCEDAGA
ncbi:hypothetical protein FIBSPDRAFT_855242 [Athelia psychrophila]|uniref:Uncharacterized protein n=1 Tax=Athelia psychrophila TaxID=1759441 RepID=A0A166PCM7_9AGAM|nr:hypothetical protein FIBSPDRAFT_861557 [Fibularhizoctonia sp. CBS 109695]KZP25951.1 hypothetical protein FIBSPDRAFT_855242 [Fibularhizoctonia sp. CBS 109695]